MAIRYCEYQPPQHRGKKTASSVFLDHPDDPHPMAICELCIPHLLRLNPRAIVTPLSEFRKGREKKG